ncbi:hypothetical protein HDU96_009052, partial [Phlyctochytrium bullatum]
MSMTQTSTVFSAAPTSYNPIELSMANGHTLSSTPDGNSSGTTYSAAAITYTDNPSDYVNMKEAPYPEGYVPTLRKLQGGGKKKKDESLSIDYMKAKAQMVFMKSNRNKFEKKKKKVVRAAGGEMWEDPTLVDWDP